MIYRCCICNKEVDVDSEETVVVKTFLDKDFAHKKCAKTEGSNVAVR
ncbi:hypothetical protein [Fredinandcohnia onubensis]|nr:hypothetical protein [Fredinandcohnia onubensis]